MKKIFHKIHLWLSVPFGIFITLICFSGATLVFEKEITEWCRPGLYFVNEIKEKTLPLDRLLEQAASTLPDSVTVTSVTILPETGRTWQVGLSKPRRASLYIDPYTGEVKGRGGRLSFYDTMFHLHRWMMGSSSGSGKLLVGVSTLVLVIILVTGILMWLTNKRKPLKRSLTISLTKGWSRFCHDLHVAGGIYATGFLLVMALTGLTWSFTWYRTGFYGLFGVEASVERGHVGHGERQDTAVGKRGHEHSAEGRTERHSHPVAHGTVQKVPSGGEEQVGPNKGEDGRNTISGEHSHNGGKGGGNNAPSYAHWQEVYENLAEACPDYRQITISDGSANVVPANRNSLRSGDEFCFETRSGRITEKKPYSAQDRSVKVRSAVYTTHVGSWGGTITRILTFLAALLGATLPLTGYYLWIRRLVRKTVHKHQKSES